MKHTPVNSSVELLKNPELSAKAAGLTYTTDENPGWTRKKRGGQFVFFDSRGKPIKSEAQLKRVRALVLPPAWQSVWISPDERGHLQATGRDARGRKQYRYHAKWTQFRNDTKFSKMILFAEKLPLIRRQILKDIQSAVTRNKLNRRQVLSSVIQIMEQTMIRIGNEEYAQDNHSYGLTTLLKKHVKVQGKKIRFRFLGKSRKFHDVEIDDSRLAHVVRCCLNHPGRDLFGFWDDEGRPLDVTSEDVNQYISEITGEPLTAKDFRTWGGTVQAALTLRELGPAATQKESKKQILQAISQTAQRLRNTPTVCKKFYIHPCVFESYQSGKLFQVHASCEKGKKNGLFQDEFFALQLLKASLTS